MKKSIVFFAALAFCGAASAKNFEQSGSLTILDTDCNLVLSEDVAINLTTGVVAGALCNAAGVAIATCHTNGRLSTRSVNVETCADADDANDDGDLECTTAAVPRSGPAIPFANTRRGTVTSFYPGSGVCNVTAAANAATANLPAVPAQ